MSDSERLASSGSDGEVLFKQRSEVKTPEPAPNSPGVVRRGNRPRVKPRSHADFLEMSPRRPRQLPALESSSDDDSDSEINRKKASSLFTNEDIQGQDMFQFKSRHTKMDLQNKVNSAINNSPKTPGSSTPKTPKKGRMSMTKRVSSLALVESTPKHVREIIKKRIIKEVESEGSGTDFSGSSSDFVPENSSESSSSAESDGSEGAPVQAQSRARRTEPARRDVRGRARRDADYVVAPDNYFLMHSSKKNTTSDHTLERLKNYNPTDALLPDVDHLSDEHKKQTLELNKSHERLFDRWLYVLSEGYSVLLYGVGSKRSILQRFQAEKLSKYPCVVVNGFFPSLTIKSVLEAIIVDLLECNQVPSNMNDTVSLIEESLSEQGADLFLIVHNIDGAMLQNGKAQSMLASLSQIKNVHTIASIDHINAPLIWDHRKLSKFNFTWWDATSYLPYAAETSPAGGPAGGGGALQLSSLRSVHRSLTSNAKRIFRIVAEYQMGHQKVAHYRGLPFKDLYSKCREQFLVSSDVALRAQLTEFLDHRLVRSRRSADGGETLTIPVDAALLQQFLDQMS